MIILLLLCALQPVEQAYRAGDYERVVEIVPAALADAFVTHDDSIRINTLRASALVALGRNEEASLVFRGLLEQEPGMDLDPEQYSPKIRAVFHEVKAGLVLSPVPGAVLAETLYSKPRLTAAVLVPGLSQLQAGRTFKGPALMAVSAVSVAGLVFTHLSYNSAHRDYVAATTPDRIRETYAAANGWNRARFGLGCTVAATWLYSLVDAAFGL